MEPYSRQLQQFPCANGNPFGSDNLPLSCCMNHASAGNFHSSFGRDGERCCVSNSEINRNASLWRPHESSSSSSQMPANRRSNKPPLLHKRFKLSNSNKQVELSFKNRKYFEFCSSSWATHRSARCLPQANMNHKYPPHRCTVACATVRPLTFYGSSKSHVSDNVDNIFLKSEKSDLNRKLLNCEIANIQINPLNFTSENNLEISAQSAPFLTFRNFSLLETPNDSTLDSSVQLMNDYHFDEQDEDFCCSSGNHVSSLKCEIPTIGISESFLNLSEGRQNPGEEQMDLLNLYSNFQLPDFDDGIICSSLESRGDDDETTFGQKSSPAECRQKPKRNLQQVTSSLSDSTAHFQPIDFFDSPLISDISADLNCVDCETSSRVQENRKAVFAGSSRWKAESAGQIHQSSRGNSGNFCSNGQAIPLYSHDHGHHRDGTNAHLDKNNRRCFVPDDCRCNASSSLRKSTKSEKSYKRQRTNDHSTKRNKSQRCQTSESQEKLFGEDWLRSNTDVCGSFEMVRPDLSDFITTRSKNDSWLPQVDVEMEEEVVETLELNKQPSNPLVRNDALDACPSQENNSENFSSFIDFFLESWYDDDVVCPFSEEILRYMDCEEGERMKMNQS